MTLGLNADEVLTTTRAVRKRLDFDKPVPREVVQECLDIALQAPTGSNTQSWQWVFVADDEKKRALADIYGKNFDMYATQSDPDRWPEGDPRRDQQPVIHASAVHLRENFHRVPVLMIPCLVGEGRLDTGTPTVGQAGGWGSLLPAVWSFMLALRERGLGSAWTTLHLPGEREAAEVLGIPFDRVTQAGLFPIAYTVGTDFKRAKRLPASDFMHWDTW